MDESDYFIRLKTFIYSVETSFQLPAFIDIHREPLNLVCVLVTCTRRVGSEI